MMLPGIDFHCFRHVSQQSLTNCGSAGKKIIIYFQSNSSHFIRWFKSQEYNRAFVTNTTDRIGDLDLNLVKK